MKILAFTDIHANKQAIRIIKEAIKKDKPDLVVCCGDISVFGRGLQDMLKAMDTFGLPVYLLHGNHDSLQTVKSYCTKTKQLTCIHSTLHWLGETLLLGWGGGGFSYTYPEFDAFVKKHEQDIKKAKHIMLITHAPPYGTKLDVVHAQHVGSKTFAKFIKKHKNAVLALSGHIHETFGKHEKLGKAVIVNPGPNGVLIEL